MKKILLLFVLNLAFAHHMNAGAFEDEKHMTVAMRMIGHQLLISAGDSSSRVLPVTRIINSYNINFDTELAIVPDSLLAIANRVSSKANIPKQYILEVITCDSNKVVYAYEVGTSESSTITPCIGRDLPKACYTVVFTDLSASESVITESNSKYWLGYVFSGLAVILALAALFLIKSRPGRSPVNPNLINLGKYRFDKLNSELIIEEQRIELTSKESDLLLLLYEMVNATVEREVLLNKVWGDEGDYIGRTLDVFISKLRKKLEFDTNVKIVNVRGVGYKLVLNQ